MTEQTARNPFDELCFNVLKAIGKALGQMNLYRANHPAVKAIVAEAMGMLSQILAQCPEEGLAYSLDQDKVIANGRIIGPVGQLPSSISGMFSRFKLNSITFKAGVSGEELGVLCQMAALRTEASRAVAAKKYLEENGVTRIKLNEAVYAKVDKAEDAATATRVGASTAAQASVSASELAQKIGSQPLEKAVEALVRYAVSDPKEQELIKETVMKRIREELEGRVAAATEQLRRQKSKMENEQIRTQAVLGNISGGVVVVDDQGKVLMMNPEAEELFGTKTVEAAGKPLVQNIKEEQMLALSSEIEAPVDRPISEQVNVAGGQDARNTLRSSSAVVQNEAGKTVGMVSALSDAAKHREIDKVEREFVAHVTHELRAPLTSIRAALEILDGMFTGRLEDEQRRMMDNALRNTDRLDDLIKGILDFSKIESGQMTVHPQACDPAKPAREAVESMQPWAMKKGLHLSLNEDPGLPPIHADNARSVQVLVNLLSNAIKFTPKGGSISVQVSAGPKEHSRFVLFSVQDTGPGIPKQDQGRVFEKFVQIAAGEKHVGGTGLGLAIAKALVHLQKGQMWLESESGAGTKFSFTLPHYVASQEAAPKPKSPPAVPWWKRLLGLAR